MSVASVRQRSLGERRSSLTLASPLVHQQINADSGLLNGTTLRLETTDIQAVRTATSFEDPLKQCFLKTLLDSSSAPAWVGYALRATTCCLHALAATRLTAAFMTGSDTAPIF